MFTIDRKMLYLLLLCVGIFGLQNVYAQWSDVPMWNGPAQWVDPGYAQWVDPGYAQWSDVPTWNGSSQWVDPGYAQWSDVPTWNGPAQWVDPGYAQWSDVPTWNGSSQWVDPGYAQWSDVPTWNGPAQGADPGYTQWTDPGYVQWSDVPTWNGPSSTGATNQVMYPYGSLTAQGIVDENGVPNVQTMRNLDLRHKQRMIQQANQIREREKRERWEREDRQRDVEWMYRDMRLKNPRPGTKLNSREQIEALRSEVRYRRNNPRPSSRVIRVNPSVTNIDRIEESRR